MASVRGIQKCGSESIFACLDARSAANSVRSAMSISLDSEKDPSEGPTEVTLPKVLSRCLRRFVGDLLDLRRLVLVVDGDEAVLVEALEGPLFFRGHRAHLREDVGVVGAGREVAGGGHEDLIAPEHRASSGAVRRVASGLAYDGFQDGELAGDPRGDLHE